MSRRPGASFAGRWLFVALVGVAGCATTAVTTGSAPATPAPATASVPPAEANGSTARRQTVAVFPFENNAVSGRERLEFLGDWLPDVVAARLHETGELAVVERREILRLLEEQKLGASELASNETRLRLGRIVGAQTIVFGSFSSLGSRVRFDGRIVDAESGLVLRTVSADGPPERVREIAVELADRLVGGLGLEVARSVHGAGLVDDRNLAGAELFYEARALEAEGRTEEAIGAYQRALELNPRDREAKERLRTLLLAPGS